MPLDFLTQAERQRYQSLPAAIAERDLRQHFHLSDADRDFVATFRGATSRLGVALHWAYCATWATYPMSG